MKTQNKRFLRGTSLVLSGLSSIALLATVPTLSQAKDGDVITTGTCSVSSTWKLKASPENGKIEIEFEVDQGKVGQTWSNVIRRNGVIVFRGNRITQGASGSYTIRKVISNAPGDDSITARAKNLSTGEVCNGSLVF
ncbi:MAG TPA: hypothetical protein V6D19_26070 [Stenomitos sp.]